MQTSYSFSNIKFSELKKIVPLEKGSSQTKFEEWFSLPYHLTDEEIYFLQDHLDFHKDLVPYYSEENLKVKFIAVILNKIRFANKKINDFYDASLTAVVNGVELNGFADYMVAKGTDEPEQPYFFLQEFKPSQVGKKVDDQLFAELVAAIALNETNVIRGCYIIGQNWYFVIMEKDQNNNYFAHISKQFDSLEIEDLLQIYKNLQIVKLHYCQ